MGAIQSLSSFLSTPHALSGCSRVNQTLYRGGREDGNRSQWLVLHSLSCVPRRSELKMDLGPSRDGLPPDGVRILSSLTSNSGNPNFIDVLPAIVLQELALYKMLTTPASSISFPSPACRRAWLSCGAHKPAGAACSQELHLPRYTSSRASVITQCYINERGTNIQTSRNPDHDRLFDRIYTALGSGRSQMPHTEYPYVTHPALYIRDTSDSHRVLEAVRLGILPVIKRRLTPDQRAELRAGNVFVWEESEHDSGFVRWTDGRRWSQSKMRGDCLYYEEKIEITDAERRARATRRALKASDSFFPIPVAPRRQDRPSKVGGLTKQTYSLMINVPGVAKAKKWHLVAYFSPRDVTHLPTVDDYDYLRNIPIPKSVFPGNPDSGTVNSLWPLEMPASPGPTPSLSPVMLAPELESAYSISRSTPLDAFPIALPPITSARLPTKSSKLPALSSLGSAMPRALGRRKGSPVTSMAGRYTYCPDDRRMLQRLRVRI